MKKVIIMLVILAIVLAGGTFAIWRTTLNYDHGPYAEEPPATITVTPTDVPGDPAVSIEITFHFEVGGLAAEGIELFINEACTLPLVDPIYIMEVIQPGNTWTFPFFAKNTGNTELTVTTATGGDTPGCNLYLTPAQATLTTGAVLPLELIVNIDELAQAGSYSGYFVITAG